MYSYKKAYLDLFNATEDALTLLEQCNPDAAYQRLLLAQQAAEEYYIENNTDDETD